MAILDSDNLGGVNDVVELTIGDAGTTRVCESYEVKQSIFTQPNGYAIRLGSSDTAKKLLGYAKPNTKTELRINGRLQQTGWTDGPEVSSNGNGGTTVTIHGRDATAVVHDPDFEADHNFGSSLSIGELTSQVLDLVVDRSYTLVYSNAANREKQSGGTVSLTVPDDLKAALTSPKNKQRSAKFGSKVWQFLKHEHEQAGLFLWATADGNFILSQPHAGQRPLYRIVRQYGQTRNRVSVEVVSYKNVTTGRFSSYEVRSRGGGKAATAVSAPNAPADIKPALVGSAGSTGRKQHVGIYVDQEMVDYGIVRPRTIINPKATTPAACEFLARRECAKDRAANWNLVYSVPGHSTVSLDGGSRIVWAVDTMVEVVDEILDLRGSFYIEGLTFRRGPDGTATELTLLRPEDLVFGDIA